jgi:hypothetical protein
MRLKSMRTLKACERAKFPDQKSSRRSRCRLRRNERYLRHCDAEERTQYALFQNEGKLEVLPSALGG